MQVEDGEARGRIRRDLGLRDLGFAALAAAIGIAIAVALMFGFRRFDLTFGILTVWGIPAILMYGLLTWTRRHDRVLRVARPIGVTLGWTLVWLLSAQGVFVALGTSIFSPIVYVVVIAILWGIPMWLSMLLAEWVVRGLLRIPTPRRTRSPALLHAAYMQVRAALGSLTHLPTTF